MGSTADPLLSRLAAVPLPQGKWTGSVPILGMFMSPPDPHSLGRGGGCPRGPATFGEGWVAAVMPTGQRTLHHRGDVLETLVLLNPSDKSLCDEVSGEGGGVGC